MPAHILVRELKITPEKQHLEQGGSIRRRRLAGPTTVDAPLLENEDYRQSNGSTSTNETPAERITTFWSNVSFLLGGILYVWIAVWDLTSPVDSSSSSSSLIVSKTWSSYDVLSAAAPFLYVINAALDIRSAILNKRERIVTLIFGIAAIMDMVGTLVDDDEIPITSVPSAMAVHFYLVQAVLAFWGGLYDYNTKTANDLLKGGDFLFLVGSLIDVILSYLPTARVSDRGIQAGSLLSASLWLVDAILYILADEYERCYDPGTRPRASENGISPFDEAQDASCNQFNEGALTPERLDSKVESD